MQAVAVSVGTWLRELLELFYRPSRVVPAWVERYKTRTLILWSATGTGLASGIAVLGAADQSEGWQTLLGTVVGMALLGAIQSTAGTLVTSAFIHAVLALFRAEEREFAKTLRCAACAQLGTLLYAIPLVGWVLGTIALWWIYIAGIKSVYRLSTTKTLVTVFSPLALAVLTALLLRSFVVEAFRISSGSMTPSLLARDHIFVSKLGRTPEYGSVWVFQHPERTTSDYVYRVIGLPGDELKLENSQPIINGWRVPRCSIGELGPELSQILPDSPGPFELFVEFLGTHRYLVLVDREREPMVEGPFAVAPGEYWVLGDNRGNAHDSRAWKQGQGTGVPEANLKGQAKVIWLSFLPDGMTNWDRFWLKMSDDPILPPGFAPEHHAALARCLQSRPPLAATTPPRPKG